MNCKVKVFREWFSSQDDNMQNVVREACKLFCSLKEEKAMEVLFALNVASSNGANEKEENYLAKAKKWVFKKLRMEQEIPEEILSAFRKEMEEQYKVDHPDFTQLQVKDSAKETFESLKSRTNVVVAVTVYNRVTYYYYTHQEDERVHALSLLKSEREKNWFGGLLEIGFKNDGEPIFLKEYHKYVEAIFEALCTAEEKKKASNRFSSYDEDKRDIYKGPKNFLVPQLPGEPADEELPFTFGPEETAVEVVQESQPEEKVVHETQAKASTLTAEAILTYKVAFACFVGGNMNALATLSNLGFDLNEVMAMQEEIKALLEAENALSNLGFDLSKVMAMKEQIVAFFEAASAFTK